MSNCHNSKESLLLLGYPINAVIYLKVRAGHVEDTSQNQDQLRKKWEIFFSRAHWKLTETGEETFQTSKSLGQMIFYDFLLQTANWALQMLLLPSFITPKVF